MELPDSVDTRPGSLAGIVKQIQLGNQQLREQLIHDNRLFVIKCVVNFYGQRYQEWENREELSVGLIAFNEAIDCYNPHKNPSFLDFAALVISRRLINYTRMTKKHEVAFPVSNFEQVDFGASSNPFGYYTEHYEIKEEISLLQKRLAVYGISFRDLAVSGPKHADSRAAVIKIAQLINQCPELSRKFHQKSSLPTQELLEKVRVSRRTIERHRKYIIAIILILESDLEIMKNYVRNAARGGKSR